MPGTRSWPLPALVLSFAAGCGSVAQAPARVDYLCAQGARFSVVYAPDERSASLELERMHFALLREPAGARDGAQRYSCSTLALSREGGRAALEIEGEPAYRDCTAHARTR